VAGGSVILDSWSKKSTARNDVMDYAGIIRPPFSCVIIDWSNYAFVTLKWRTFSSAATSDSWPSTAYSSARDSSPSLSNLLASFSSSLIEALCLASSSTVSPVLLLLRSCSFLMRDLKRTSLSRIVPLLVLICSLSWSISA
jgi:hypothetical protein